MPPRELSYRLLATVAIVVAAECPCRAGGANVALGVSEGELLFVRRVQPLLKSKCLPCHGGDPADIRAEFDVRSRDLLLAGGWSDEPALEPGDPAHSPLYLSAAREGDWSPMPPKENDAIAEEDLARLRRWIEVGAPWPNEKRAEAIRAEHQDRWDAEAGVAVATSGGLSADWTNRRYDPESLWAYQPLWRDLDGLYGNGSAAIDALLGERMTSLGVQPAPPADRRSLIRRATYDLTGLPPTPAEIEQFVADPDSDRGAFAKVVDRLLASPHYGERWGQHWLDVTRYADSSGFANDYERGNAWRYRDYVVRSSNEDKPYDQFVREQIAGDELDPSDPEMLIAVGFLRMGPWELTTMEVPRVARQRFLDDATDSIGQVFLGHMLQCARCHDHKFDPVPTRDYYSIQAALATTQLVERDAAFLPEENLNGFEERELIDARQQFYTAEQERLEEKELQNALAWFDERTRDSAAFRAAVQESDGDARAARASLIEGGVPEDLLPPLRVGFQPADFGIERIVNKGQQRIAWQLDRYEPIAFSVYNGHTRDLQAVNKPVRMPRNRLQGELEQTAILGGGDPFSPTLPVQPAVLSAVVGVQQATPPANNVLAPQLVTLLKPDTADPKFINGRRTALADWIVSDSNPLTPRVMANRIWQGHFGRGIAGNANNFGGTGKRPTHPKLLDWLAGELVDSGWSVKHLHRLIMMSDAYRRAASHPSPESLAGRDPRSESYAVFAPRRLTAEELRDAMLACSGELNLEVGGIPVRPEINLEVALQPRMVMGTFAEAWQPSATPDRRHRRSLYVLRPRGVSNPFMEVFNAPSPDLSAERRESSTITPQVFSLFNGQGPYLRALAMANRLTKECAKLGAPRRGAIERAFLLCYGRVPSDDEAAACLGHWTAMAALHADAAPRPIKLPGHVVRHAVEENTGERFRFTEPLGVADIFEPDLQPCDTTPAVRGLAEVCLVLMNSNEFVYVY